MTVKQILALSAAGFTEEQITLLTETLADDAQPEAPAQPEQPAQPEPETPAQPEQPAQADDTPAWFGKFLQRYNEDYEQLSKGLLAKNVRHAGAGDPGAAPKTPEQLMAEAYMNIK